MAIIVSQDAPPPYFVLVLLCVGAAAALVPLLVRWSLRRKAFPVVGYPMLKLFPGDGEDDLPNLNEGYQKYGDRAYQLWTRDGPFVILPLSFADELDKLPEGTIDLWKGNLFPKYTQVRNDPPMVEMVRKDLLKNLPSHMKSLVHEISTCIDRFFSSAYGEDWTALQVYPALLEVVAQSSGKLLVGDLLNEHPRWHRIRIDWVAALFNAARKLRYTFWGFRPVKQFFIPELREMRRLEAEGIEIFRQAFEKRKAQARSEVREQDTIDWFQGRLVRQGSDPEDLHRLVKAQLFLALGSIHSVTMLVTHVLYDLAAHPEYHQSLRQEIDPLIQANNGVLPDGVSPLLLKVDSFMKETQRHNPAGYLGMMRSVFKGFHLSDGTYIPAGCTIAVQTQGITADHTIFDEPANFDGLRYYKLRQVEGNASRFQLTSSSDMSLMFGFGRKTCPGRFLATAEAKIMFATIVHRFDVSLAPGAERPKNIRRGTQIRADPEATIRFRTRQSPPESL